MRRPVVVSSLLSALLVLAVVAGQPAPPSSCPVDNFKCGATKPGEVIVTSWCSATNPFLVPQPPSSLANASTDFANYQPAYACQGNVTTNPLNECTVIEAFSAWETAAGLDEQGNINATAKVIVVSTRQSGDARPFSNLNLFDEHFNLVSSPVQSFWGRIDFVEVSPLVYTNSTTSLIAYGGATYNNFSVFPAPPCDPIRGCVYVSFVSMNLTATGGKPTTDAFTFSGQFYEQPANISDVASFLAIIGSQESAALYRRRQTLRRLGVDSRSEAAKKMRESLKRHGQLLSSGMEPSVVLGADAPSFADMPDAVGGYPPVTANLVSLLVYNKDETNEFYGFSIVTLMYFQAGDPLCDMYLPDWGPFPCMLPLTRWKLRRNGNPIPATVPMSLQMTTAFWGCTLADRRQAVSASYGNFYNSTNCVQKRVLAFISTDTTISSFSFIFDANFTTTELIDLDSTPGARVFNSAETVGPNAVITQFAPMTEVALTAPLPANAPPSGPVPVQPGSVWLSVATYNPGSAAEREAVLRAKRERRPHDSGDWKQKAKRGSGQGWTQVESDGQLRSSSAGSLGSLIIMRLPQFSDPINGQNPPLATPTITNPAGLPPQGVCTQWSYYWDGSSCVPQPVLAYQGLDVWATTIGARWRYLPSQISTLLIEGNCQLYDTQCITNLINSTFYNSTSKTNGPTAVSLKSPEAASHYAAMTVEEKRAFRRLWNSFVDRAEAFKSGSPFIPALDGLSAGHPAPARQISRRQAYLSGPNNPAGADAAEVQAAAYGNRFMVFAAAGNRLQMDVFDALPLGCLDPTGIRVVSSIQSRLPLLGSMATMQVTPNAQYVFGSTLRPYYFLKSAERSVQICNALAADPDDPFLQAYASSCNPSDPLLKPRLPSVPDFLTIASSCVPGALCNSFNAEFVSPLPAGQISSFGFDVADAPAGTYASNGRALSCPMGFVCPSPGSTLPTVCSGADPSLNTTCAANGLIEPMVCPEGTLCGVPILPPIPANPGFLEFWDAPNQQRGLTPCASGEWCSLGRSLSERHGNGSSGSNNALLCPGSTFCSTPSVVEPTVCSLNGTCTRQSCTSIPYCPAGSTTDSPCPAGYFCPSLNQSVACSEGTFCPAGSPLWSLCPAGSYCPNPAEKVACDPGSFCLEGSVQPQECSFLSHCFCDGPHGSGCQEPPANMVLAVAGMMVFFMVGLYIAWRFWLKKIWLRKKEEWKRQKLQALRRKSRADRVKVAGGASSRNARLSIGLPLLETSSVTSGSSTSSLSLVHGSSGSALTAASSASAAAAPSPSKDEDEKPLLGVRFAPMARSDSSSTNTTATDAEEAAGGYSALASPRTAAISSRLSRRISAARGAIGSSSGSSNNADIRPPFPMHISFRKLGLRIKKDTSKKVLNDVSGEFKPGRVCAVMGPSGAGKSSMLTALSGKATYGILEGEVDINGKPGLLTDSRYKHLLGFVPQEDTMLRDLTVEENIVFSAMSRLPASWSEDAKLTFADNVITLLQLDEIRDSQIGDEMTRGISGGQRKRVNIGIELAAAPQVLFLDEPTSGLDSAGTTAVCQALRRIAEQGVTVALVLHQPRFECFIAFDDLLLLGKGGKTVYYGPVPDALPYFEAAMGGLRCQPRINPIDFILDCVSGEVPAEWKAAHPQWKPSELFDLWQRQYAANQQRLAALADAGSSSEEAAVGKEFAVALASAGSTSKALVVPSTTASINAVASDAIVVAAPASVAPGSIEGGLLFPVGAVTSTFPVPTGEPPKAEPASFLNLLWLFFTRSITQQLRHPLTFAINNLLNVVAALGLAAVYVGQAPYSAPLPIEAFQGCPSAISSPCQIALSAVRDTILTRATMSTIAIGLTGAAAFLNVFGGYEKIVYYREAASLPSYHSAAYFLGKDLSMVLQLLVGPLVFTVSYEALATPRMSFTNYWLVFAGVYWCSSALGYLVSVVAPASLAQLCGVIAVFSNAQFSGGSPTLVEMQQKFIPLRWFPWVSYMRYALEALYVGEVSAYSNVVSLQGLSLAEIVKTNFGYDLDAFPHDVLALFLFGLGIRIIALLLMTFLHQDKKK